MRFLCIIIIRNDSHFNNVFNNKNQMKNASKISGITIIIVLIVLTSQVLFSSFWSLLLSLMKLELPNFLHLFITIVWVYVVLNVRKLDIKLTKLILKYIK